MNLFTSPEKPTDKLSLPAISPMKPSSASSSPMPTSSELTFVVDGSAGKSSRKKDKLEKSKSGKFKGDVELTPDPIKPLDFDFWVRCMDVGHNIYYYNSHTGDTAWLGPCVICYKHSDKWCQDCHTQYCDKHFAKKHNTQAIDPVDPANVDEVKNMRHKWSTKEIPTKQELQSANNLNQPKCIECNIKAPTKMCLECWDPYCNACFDVVHHVGSLKYHKVGLYHEVMKGWVGVRNPPSQPANVFGDEEEGEVSKPQQPDFYYYHGVTKETVYEKPKELMNDLEKTLFQNFVAHREYAEKLVAQIETLQLDLEKARYERDQLLVERVQWMTKEGGTEKTSKTSKKAGMFGGGANNDDSNKEYYDKLMNPSNRKRGEGRSNYIQSLLDAPLPT